MKQLLLVLMLAMGGITMVAWSTPRAATTYTEKACCRGACDCQVKDHCCRDTQCQEDGTCT
jgi:hypothetical protein